MRICTLIPCLNVHVPAWVPVGAAACSPRGAAMRSFRAGDFAAEACSAFWARACVGSAAAPAQAASPEAELGGDE